MQSYEIKKAIPVTKMRILSITLQTRISIDFLCLMVKYADELDILAHIKVTIFRHTLVRYIFEDDYLEEYFHEYIVF